MHPTTPPPTEPADPDAWGEWTYLDGRWLRTHRAADCTAPCAIHNPSPHHMREWTRHWRGDRRTIERICPEHGVGHPDPDDAAHRARMGDGDTVHGCCGCCVAPEAEPGWRLIVEEPLREQALDDATAQLAAANGAEPRRIGEQVRTDPEAPPWMEAIRDSQRAHAAIAEDAARARARAAHPSAQPAAATPPAPALQPVQPAPDLRHTHPIHRADGTLICVCWDRATAERLLNLIVAAEQLHGP